ncbi:MAG: response regulator [Chloroflexaceae bacterium]
MIRVFIADDHPIVREGMRSLIGYQMDMTLVGEADDGSQVLPQVATLTPDVVLIDLRMPRLGGLDVLRRLQEQAPAPACLVLSSYDEPAYVLAAIEAGARGYLLKHSAYGAILDAIRAVTRGEHVVSPALVGTLFSSVTELRRERVRQDLGGDASALRVLRALADGATTSEISSMLHVSEVTVKRRIQELTDLLGVRNRTQLVAEAMRRGWI